MMVYEVFEDARRIEIVVSANANQPADVIRAQWEHPNKILIYFLFISDFAFAATSSVESLFPVV